MPLLDDWLTVFVAGCLVIMAPGPNFFMTVRNSVIRSRRSGLFTALGIATGDGIHIALWLVGIGVLISRSILLFTVIKWLGAGYLLYVGLQSIKAKPHQSGDRSTSPSTGFSARAAFRSGLLTCLLNPKVALFLLALFTQIIRPGTPLIEQIIYGSTIVGIELLWLIFVATVMSQGTIQRLFLSISHWFERVMGTVLVFFGIRLALARAVRE